jgi:hypothetical protein
MNGRLTDVILFLAKITFYKPQGSVLSVSCFLIAMNGLQSYVLDNLISNSEGIELVFLAC